MKKLIAIAFASILLFSLNGYSHSRWDPGQGFQPVNTSSGVKNLANSCGLDTADPITGNTVVSNAAVVAVTPGVARAVEWEETINHEGHYEFYYSTEGDCDAGSGTCWNPLIVTGTQSNRVDDNQGAGVATPHKFNASLDIPTNLNCTGANCLMQVRQFMAGPNTYYFSCFRFSTGTVNNNTPPDNETLGAQCKMK